MIAYANARLKEPSTWNAIVGMAIAIGIIYAPDKKDEVLGLGAAIYAFINVVWKRDTQSRGTGDGTKT
jgi:hypothetical protein